ncbi:Rv1733c family protein [Streptomyces phaeofaciens]|uniref:Rv1733c family protein n=1 Tax=Streptomyces phaeofaciens TaxID=68254 RepID=UPI0036940AAC
MSGEIPPAQPPPAPEPHGRDHPRPPLPLMWLWLWRRNPLRRRTDRLQGRVALGLLLLLPAPALLAMFGVGDTAYRHYRTTAEHQARIRHHTTAVLVHDAPGHLEPGSDEARGTHYPVTVRFTGPGGQARTGKTDVIPGVSAGSTVSVWVGADGTLTEPPLTAEEIRSRAMGWALVAFLTVAVAGGAVYGAVAGVLRRRNLEAWDAMWAETAPRWSRAHGSPR